MMALIDHTGQPMEEWRPGVVTRMRVSALTGAVQLCIFDQWCDRDTGAPIHLHAVEEVLEVIEGTAEITCGETTHIAGPDQSIVIPAGCRHGFRNIGENRLHVRATLAAPIFEAAYDNKDETPRRWLP